MAEPVITIDPEQILYCQDCFEAGRCPPEARREQATMDNPDLAIVCADCRDRMLAGFDMIDSVTGKPINL